MGFVVRCVLCDMLRCVVVMCCVELCGVCCGCGRAVVCKSWIGVVLWRVVCVVVLCSCGLWCVVLCCRVLT